MLFAGIFVMVAILFSCERDPEEIHWFEDGNHTIVQYLEQYPESFSMFYDLLDTAKLLGTIGAYNPASNGYTLFLPDNEAIKRYIQESEEYSSFAELLADTGFTYTLVRNHTLGESVRSDKFPYGAIEDKTLSGKRLVIRFVYDGDSANITVNSVASILKSDLKMTNGFIHIISEVLRHPSINGYDYLQSQKGFSILTAAMEKAGIKDKLWLDKYTILAEHDSIYKKNQIYNVDDLYERVIPPGDNYTSQKNAFYNFVANHILFGEYYLNDFLWGKESYWTMGNRSIEIEVGNIVRINPGISIYGSYVDEYGETIYIDYASPLWEYCNIMTSNGPVHSISEMLLIDPLN